jgi:acetolactate synthase-1/2/3 large subunit
MRVSDYIFDRLVSLGATHVYAVSGRGALFLTDAVAKNKELSYVAMHHEQGAGFAAVSHSDFSNTLGICLVSTGCASTNAVTATLSAWQDGIPVVFISGQNTLRETTNFTGKAVRTFGQQEADIIPIVSSITKYSVMVKDPADIGIIVDRAIYEATSGRMGPVWIDVPLDIQSATVHPDELVRWENNKIEKNQIDETLIHEVLSSIQKAKRPIVLIGSGTKNPEAKKLINQLVNEFHLPVVYSASAVDVADADSPFVIGSVGMMACSRVGNFAIQNSDYVLVLGNRLTSMTTGVETRLFAPRATIDVVDLDPVEHTKHDLNIRNIIECDCSSFLGILISRLSKTSIDPWLQTLAKWRKELPLLEPSFETESNVDLYQLADSLAKYLPLNATLVTDSGLNELILPSNIRFHDSQRCIHPASQGAMGFSLPAAVGAHFAGAKHITVVVGDGSIMMNVQELETIRNNKIPLRVIVVNNNVYAVIRKRQQELFRNRTIGTDPANGVSVPDFHDLAKCFGFEYRLVENLNQLNSELEAPFLEHGPVLIEVIGKPEQDYIQTTQIRDETKRFIRLPLDNQHPLLEVEKHKQLMNLPGNLD